MHLRNYLDNIRSTVTSRLTETAANIVSGLLGVRSLSVRLLNEGLMTYKCRVQTDLGDVIVRFYPPSRSTVVNQEPDLLMRCALQGIPVPQLIGDSRSGPQSPLAYIAYYRIAGSTLSEALKGSNKYNQFLLAKDLARHLRKLQEIQFEGTGELESSTAAYNVKWEIFVEQSLRNGLKAIQQYNLLDIVQIQDISQVIDQGLPINRRMTHQLVWGDINFDNIIIDDTNHIASLIDFESCLSGDPLATLGYCYAAHGPEPFFSLLLESWQPPLTADDHYAIAQYALLRALRLARYAHLPLPTGRPRDPLVDIFPGIIPALQYLVRQHH